MIDLSDEQIRALGWYYEVELRPGVFTKGRRLPNVAATRRLLDGLMPDGLRALDIGTMEGLISTVLARGGASVVAYDRLNLEDRWRLVKDAHAVDFEIVSGVQIPNIPSGPYDLVVFSGVLYHMLDPLAGLARVRSFVRDEGIVILETKASTNDGHSLAYNGDFKLGPVCYFLPTAMALDAMLRFVNLQPLDVLTVQPLGNTVRIAVACRAVPHGPMDDWPMTDKQRIVAGWDLDPIIDWQRVATGRPAVPYTPVNPQNVFRPGGSVDVAQTLKASPPIIPELDEMRLRLSA